MNNKEWADNKLSRSTKVQWVRASATIVTAIFFVLWFLYEAWGWIN